MSRPPKKARAKSPRRPQAKSLKKTQANSQSRTDRPKRTAAAQPPPPPMKSEQFFDLARGGSIVVNFLRMSFEVEIADIKRESVAGYVRLRFEGSPWAAIHSATPRYSAPCRA